MADCLKDSRSLAKRKAINTVHHRPSSYNGPNVIAKKRSGSQKTPSSDFSDPFGVVNFNVIYSLDKNKRWEAASNPQDFINENEIKTSFIVASVPRFNSKNQSVDKLAKDLAPLENCGGGAIRYVTAQDGEIIDRRSSKKAQLRTLQQNPGPGPLPLEKKQLREEERNRKRIERSGGSILRAEKTEEEEEEEEIEYTSVLFHQHRPSMSEGTWRKQQKVQTRKAAGRNRMGAVNFNSEPDQDVLELKLEKKYALQRYTYSGGKCVLFTWSGCGGSGNRFHSLRECDNVCKGLKPSNNAPLCSYDADWGPCNQLTNKWFFNQSTGYCAQFLYGGCGGNPNRFDSFEVCQKTCEVTGEDPCMAAIDRGKWCEPMSNRYYWHKKRKKCVGFHYTGCGISPNNFVTEDECKKTCEKRHGRSLPDKSVDSRLPIPMDDRVTHDRSGRAPKKKPTKAGEATSYSQKKPIEKSELHKHIILEGNGTTYHKTPAEWVDHNMCFAYRYNVTGPDAKLETHLCAKESSEDCWSEIIPNTKGDEFCHVVRPFLKGVHKYTWFFSIIGGDFVNGRRSREGLRAAILILKPSICHQIC